MSIFLRSVAIAAATVAATATAATPPGPMMANVYRLTEASAVLSICFESAEFKALPSDRATALKDLSARLGDLVQGIAGHYRDDSLYVTYENTRARIAADGKLKLQVKQMYQYCGERLSTEMERYVAENEALIGGYLKRAAARR
jgi:hypothetical protein